MITASYVQQATVTWILGNGSADVTVTQDLGTSVASYKPLIRSKRDIGLPDGHTKPETSEAELSSLTDDMVITASYQGQATVRWVLDNGSPDVTVTQDLGTSVVSSKPADPAKAGFRFTGWTYETGDSEAELSSLTDDMVITASYVQQATVTWKLGNGSPDVTVTQDLGTSAVSSKPADPAKAGFRFTGWTYETGDSEAELSSLTDDMVITASYQEQATVRWVLDNGSPDVTVTQDLGTSVASYKPADPAKAGFRFTGWTYETGDSEAELSSLTDDMVITASYVQQATVTWILGNGSADVTVTQDLGTSVASYKPADPIKSGHRSPDGHTKPETAKRNFPALRTIW